MTDQKQSSLRLYFTALVMLGEWAHLAWQHFNGGVVSHHILNSAELPAISNWWGVVVLPAITWFLVGRIRKRAALNSGQKDSTSRAPVGIVVGFVGSLTFGIALSVAFTNDYATISSALFFGALVLAMFLPVYRAECVLGFILGMAFTFGAVLPTVIGSLIAAVSAFFNFYVHPALAWLVNAFKRTRKIDPVRVRGSGDR